MHSKNLIALFSPFKELICILLSSEFRDIQLDTSNIIGVVILTATTMETPISKISTPLPMAPIKSSTMAERILIIIGSFLFITIFKLFIFKSYTSFTIPTATTLMMEISTAFTTMSSTPSGKAIKSMV
jgi:hypothetical protein